MIVSLYFEIELTTYWGFILLCCISIPIFTIIFASYQYYPLKHKAIGRIKIGTDNSQIGDNIYSYVNTNGIDLSSERLQWQKITNPRFYNRFRTFTEGVENRLGFQYEEKKIDVEFQLESQSQFRLLGKHLEYLY